MKTCPYCASEVVLESDHLYYCDFCVMQLQESNVSEDGKRQVKGFKSFAFREWIDKTTPELMAHHIVELLFLLKEIRKLRTDYFSTLRTFNKGYSEAKSVEDRKLLEEAKSLQGVDYEEITRKLFVVENIILERIGYIPPRIDERFLASYIEKCEKPVKDMIIKKESKHLIKG